MTTLHDFGGVLRRHLDTFFGLLQFHGHSSWLVCVVALMCVILEPLHTRVKSRDHDKIVRAPKRKRPKAVTRHLQNCVVWLRFLECIVKSYVTGPSTKCYFNENLFMWVLTHDKVK